MLSLDERERLYNLVSSISGTCQEPKYRHEIIVTNVEQRIRSTGLQSLEQYLVHIEGNQKEKDEFLSAITIHTTSWFREFPHFEKLNIGFREALLLNPNKHFRILSAACSTGQEVYSLALLLESLKSAFPKFSYEILGIDIDPKSILSAQQAIFPVSQLESIPEHFRKPLLIGSEKTKGFFTLSREIRNCCKFEVLPLQALPSLSSQKFDRVLCRNVLIYFTPLEVSKLVSQLVGILAADGMLILGHSEAIDANQFKLQSIGNACYSRYVSSQVKMFSDIKDCSILIIDDCLVTRMMLTKHFESGGIHCECVGSANEATSYLKKKNVDLVTLDLSMPEVDGITWLKSQRALGMRVPVMVVSASDSENATEVLGALEAGAQDFVDKTTVKRDELLARVKGLVSTNRARKSSSSSSILAATPRKSQFRPEVILIGASTGGPQALTRVLSNFSVNSPPIVVAQHITHEFSVPFAQRLAEVSGLIWEEPVHGQKLQNGHIYISAGDYHIGVRAGSQGYTLVTSDTSAINRHRPSVDFLFRSACLGAKAKVLAILLTGMGEDGARGLLELKDAGACTICQDEHSSVVFGMPKEAIRLGAAQITANLYEIRDYIMTSI